MDIDEIKLLNDEYKFFSINCDVSKYNSDSKTNKLDTKSSNNKLSEFTISLKDAIWLKDVETTASSNILKGFNPIENSFVVEKILDNGGRIIGKTTQDEFGFGTFCMNVGSNYEIPLNPVDKERVSGGSSGGAAVAAKLIDNHISIAESTGGSITTPASFCGVVGVCPSYGRVSRNGLITYSSSLDKIGVMSKEIKDSALALEIISGKDPKDETSSNLSVGNYVNAVENYKKITNSIKIGILDFDGVDSIISNRINELSELLKNKSIGVDKIDLPFTKKYSLSSYYIIAMSEASTHLASLSGLRYGVGDDVSKNYNDYFSDVRTKHFSQESKRRILLGTYVRMAGYRGKYYTKALKVRRKIINEYKSIFAKYDVILCASSPVFAPKFSEAKSMSISDIYNLDLITSGPNLAGLPNMSVPINKTEELPFGALIIANHYEEEKLFAVGSLLGDFL